MHDKTTKIVSFWFGDRVADEPLANMDHWFSKKPLFDDAVAKGFKSELDAGLEPQRWKASPQSSLAFVLLTDQFPRHIWRGQKRAFEFDALALSMAHEGVLRGWDQSLHWIERSFYYLPFEHSENLEDQEMSVGLFEKIKDVIPSSYSFFSDENISYAQKHLQIIRRFGRFPHRNAILDRASTREESLFLSEPDSSF